jgi:hypothetical protein
MNRRGNVMIALAIVGGVVAVMLARNVSTSAAMAKKQQIEVINRIEGFYTSEIAAWHSYQRTKYAFSPPAGAVQDSGGRFLASLDNDFAGVPSSLAPLYDSATSPAIGGFQGTPFSVVDTQALVGNAIVARRVANSTATGSLVNNTFLYLPTTSGTSCGEISLGASRRVFRNCLVESTLLPLYMNASGEIFETDAINNQTFHCTVGGVCDPANFGFYATTANTDTFRYGSAHFSNGLRTTTFEAPLDTISISKSPRTLTSISVGGVSRAVTIVDRKPVFRLRADGRLQIYNNPAMGGLSGDWVDLTYADTFKICNPDPACHPSANCVYLPADPPSCRTSAVTLPYVKAIALMGAEGGTNKAMIALLEPSGNLSGAIPSQVALGDLNLALFLQAIAFAGN